MVRSETEPKKSEQEYRNYRDDPRYKETGKQYGPWPPYPEWQDMPLRRFGMGFGKKGVNSKSATSDVKPGAELQQLGNGRRKYGEKNNGDHFDYGFVPLQGKDEQGRFIDQDQDKTHGKHHFFVKDHLNEESSTQVSSSRASRDSRGQSSCTDGSRRASAASRPRSAR
jgi:hypothetical protein